KVLEKMNIPYIVWSVKKIKNKLKAIKIIEAPLANSKEQLIQQIGAVGAISHVIAGTEEAVFPATKARMWLEARRNPLSLIIRCTDKLKMKEFLKSKKIPMTEYISGQTEHSTNTIIDRLGTPVVAKPRKSSGGRGLKFLNSEDELALEKNKDIIFEKSIQGTEGSVESLIINGKVQFTNITEYLHLGHCNLVPGHYDLKFKKQVLDLNAKVIDALNIQWGMTHMEFYRTADSKILFGEIAIRPPGGYIMESLTLAYSCDFWELFVKNELNLLELPRMSLMNYTASIIIHPQPGKVKSISGMDEIANLESLKKFKLKLKPHQEIHKRLGVGQDHGYALLAHLDKDQLLNDVNNFDRLLKIEMF
ncbi:MAG: ATP-grasp domain-containing protein, partial [Bdellovibrionales bacterium]|nr:ATP-grasp domain-containing protein [Bdellovibrionales bacterium]